MSANTKIEWTDHTFNPWWGCQKVGPGCDHCYAETLDKRTGGQHWGPGAARRRTGEKNWQDPIRWNKQAFWQCEECGQRGTDKDLAKTKGQPCYHEMTAPVRQRVFCASMADVFDNAVEPQWRHDLFSLILSTPNLDWLLLTKRIGNVRNLVDASVFEACKNIWLGATIVNQEEADRDIPKLLAVPAAKRFLSMEPLLGPVDLTRIDINGDCEIYPLRGTTECVDGEGEPTDDIPAIDWVIVGGESGPGARPMSPDWARSLRDQCKSAGVPYLFKQWGEWVPMLGQVEGVPVRNKTTTQDGWVMGNAGKKAAGRMLDGRTWDGVPA